MPLARSLRVSLVASVAVAAALPAQQAPSFPSSDPVLQRIWALGMDSSRTYDLAQALMDSIGPRLTGTPGMRAGQQWLVNRYREWGIDARNEQYGTWKGWTRGVTHIDLMAPRVRTLEGMLLAWSAGTRGRDVTAPVVILPDVADSAALARVAPQLRGKFVLVSYAEPTCRPNDDWRQFAMPGSFERMDSLRNVARTEWNRRVQRTGGALSLGTGTLGQRLEALGVAGVIASRWSNGWGVNKIFDAKTERVPSLDIACEDYGLLFRLAERNQGPVLRVRAEGEFQGEVPVHNTIATIRGSQKPDEYVMLSAHFDSWDGGSGATDNGTGTVVMLEAMRILRQVYPQPKRTILVGHWSGEEQGLVGSRAFAADHPEVVRGLQALFNQDNGTGRIQNLSANGLIDASASLARWLSRVPDQLTADLAFRTPGAPGGGGSDFAAFLCYSAPAFNLGALGWNYGTYTWHTNRDTFDKIVFDDLRRTATLTAMLVYLAAEDPNPTPREQRVVARTPAGAAGSWPQCQVPPRNTGQWTR